MSEAIYHLQQLVKNYEGRRVVDVETLSIYRGEILALVGPSGAGKSTLLRLLNFLEPPDQGSVIFQGVDFFSSNGAALELRRKVTMVFQRPMLLNRSVWENVAFGLNLRGQRQVDEKITSALEQVGLSNLKRARARTLSGGEAQRVALARAIVLRPEVLLLDEPTANLDPYNVGLIENIVSQLNRDQGTTIVVVTHNVFQAKRLAHRVAFLLDGKIIEAAESNTFFNYPSNPRTAAFVRGEMVY
jgi:tungstate transport system ATP-binding protein